jgi:small subunit ribosomal protein S5
VARIQVDPELLKIEKLVQLKPVSKTVKGGRKRRFSALVVVGDGNGHVGVGMGKSASVPDAIRKGQRAEKSLVEVPLIDATIPHMVIGRTGAARVMLKPATPGTGVIAGPATRAVAECAGIKDILTKSMGSDNIINNVYAALDGLRSMQKAPDVAKRRGKELRHLSLPARLKDASLYESRQPEYARPRIVRHAQPRFGLNHGFLQEDRSREREGRSDILNSSKFSLLDIAFLFRSFDNFQNAPALGFGDGARFHNAHAVARFAFVRLIVGMVFLGDALHAAIKRVTLQAHHGHHSGFIHFIADHKPFAHFARGAAAFDICF